MITGVECTISSSLKQQQLIQLAKETRYKDCSMPGLYEMEGVGIVLLKNGEVNFQMRNRRFTIGSLHDSIYNRLVTRFDYQNQSNCRAVARLVASSGEEKP